MDVDAVAELPVPASRAHAVLADLGTYPSWLSIVQGATSADAHPDDSGPAWAVDLGARLGPLRRTKRVRMVRTDCEAPLSVRYERVEHDGRQHSAWILTGVVEPTGPDACRVRMHIHYGGTRALPVADVILAAEVRRAGARLGAYLSEADLERGGGSGVG